MIGDNETAFPVVHPDGSGVQYFGISKREYFATMALQGALANPSRSGTPAEYAEFARMCAGALLAELAK